MAEVNEAPILDQMREHWQKLAALIVWKLAPAGVTITHQDLILFQTEGKILLTHGHKDSIDFRMVTSAEAQRLTDHEAATNRGSA